MWTKLMDYLRTRILRRQMARHAPPEEDTLGDMLDAQRSRRVAERKLEQTRLAGREVTTVSKQAQHLREQNNFSARWEAALRRPRG